MAKFTVYIRQTPLGAIQWQLFDMSKSQMVAHSMDFETRDQAFKALKEHAPALTEASVIDQTPEALRKK